MLLVVSLMAVGACVTSLAFGKLSVSIISRILSSINLPACFFKAFCDQTYHGLYFLFWKLYLWMMAPPHLQDIVYNRPKTLDSTFDVGGDTSSTLIAVSNMCEFVNIQTILGESRIYVLVYQHSNHPRWSPDKNKTHKNANISQGARLWCCNMGSLEVFGTRYFQISIQVWNIFKFNIFRYIVGGCIHLIGFAILPVCFKSRAPGAKTITTFIRARCFYLP